MGSLSVKTIPSSVATAATRGIMEKSERSETARLSRPTMKTKYKATEANGACRINSASNVKTLASTIRKVPLKRPGPGCRSCQILPAHAVMEFARDGTAKGGRDETRADEEGFSIAFISPR
jgi:hypothetical protein